MHGAIPPPPQYVFMEWCLVKHRDFTYSKQLNSVSIPSPPTITIHAPPTNIQSQTDGPIFILFCTTETRLTAINKSATVVQTYRFTMPRRDSSLRGKLHHSQIYVALIPLTLASQVWNAKNVTHAWYRHWSRKHISGWKKKLSY